MELSFTKSSVKFLNKLSAKEAEKIREKLSRLLESIEVEDVIPFNELDIKALKGEWKDFSRMRVGKIRVIFKINAEEDELIVYDIDYRGTIYKSMKLAESSRQSLLYTKTNFCFNPIDALA